MSEKKCPRCKAVIEGKPKFCADCGAPLQGQSSPKAKKTNKNTSVRDTLITVAVLAVAATIFFLMKSSEPDPHAGHNHDTEQTQSSQITIDQLGDLPTDYNTLVGMGNQFMDERNMPVAAEIYSRALAIDGTSPNVRTDYGACLHALGMNEEALAQFKQVNQEHPNHTTSIFNVGIVYYGMGQSDSARVYWQKYLTLDPNGNAAESARSFLEKIGG